MEGRKRSRKGTQPLRVLRAVRCSAAEQLHEGVNLVEGEVVEEGAGEMRQDFIPLLPSLLDRRSGDVFFFIRRVDVRQRWLCEDAD
jgi:hypothetical protein